VTLAVRGDRVLVEPIDQSDQESDAGIVLIDAYRPPDVMGTVVACGAVREVQVGDVVLFPPSAGQVMTYEGRRYLVLVEDELIAVLEAA
jgi:chaperonin GroES